MSERAVKIFDRIIDDDWTNGFWAGVSSFFDETYVKEIERSEYSIDDIEEAINPLLSFAKKYNDKYFDVVWRCRSYNYELIEEVDAKYPGFFDLRDQATENGDISFAQNWFGMMSGRLASVRFFLNLFSYFDATFREEILEDELNNEIDWENYGINVAISNWPMFDT